MTTQDKISVYLETYLKYMRCQMGAKFRPESLHAPPPTPTLIPHW